MPLLIVQEDECSAPKDHPQSPDKTSRNHLIGIDRLAMPIDVEDRGLTRRALLSWVPQGGSPCGKNLRQIFSPVRLHDLGKEPLCMRVAIGTRPSGEKREHISSVAPHLPRAMHSSTGGVVSDREYAASDMRRGPFPRPPGARSHERQPARAGLLHR